MLRSARLPFLARSAGIVGMAIALSGCWFVRPPELLRPHEEPREAPREEPREERDGEHHDEHHESRVAEKANQTHRDD